MVKITIIFSLDREKKLEKKRFRNRERKKFDFLRDNEKEIIGERKIMSKKWVGHLKGNFKKMYNKGKIILFWQKK